MPVELPTPSSGSARDPNPVAGVIVLSSSLRVLYMNKRARYLCDQLRLEKEKGAVTTDLPELLLEYGQEVLHNLRTRLDEQNWDRFMLQRGSPPSHRQIVIRALGLPDRNGLTQSRILFYMETRREPHLSPSDRLRYRFLLGETDTDEPGPRGPRGTDLSEPQP